LNGEKLDMDTSQPVPSLQTKEYKIVLLPIGSCEQHGPYLPIDTDLRIAKLLAIQLAETFPQSHTLLLEAIPFSCSWEHKGFGTIAINTSTLSAILHDLSYSLKTWKMPFLLILVNWHGGNEVLTTLATEITARENIPTAVIPSIGQIGKAGDNSHITLAKDIHAGAIETSIIQAYWPELIQRPIIENAHCEPQISPAKAQTVLQSLGSYMVTKAGVWGAPEDADPVKGRNLIEALVKEMHIQISKLAELVNEYKRARI
jgi:creatinine amidohydrolase/Fe(II)-dependent formamide hydrolase-like protein